MSEYSESKGPCQFCGYILAGLRTGVCPECGSPVFRFTDRARKLVDIANAKAIEGISRAGDRWRWWHVRSRHPATIKPVHLLLALVTGPEGVGRFVLQQSGAPLDDIRDTCRAWTPRMPCATVSPGSRLPLDPQARLVIDSAINAALKLGHDWVGTEHLLLGLIDRGDRVTRRLLTRGRTRRAEICRLIQENMERVNAAPAVPSE